MAISSYKTFLMVQKTVEGSEVWEKLVDIKDYSDLGGPPETIDTTTLSDPVTTSIPGIQQLDALTFTMNFTKEDFLKVDALKDTEQQFAVWFGGNEVGGVVTPTGDKGKVEFKGSVSIFINGAGVNEVINATITINASSAFTFVSE